MRKKIFRCIVLFVAITLLLTTVAFASVTSSAYIAATNTYITRSGNDVKVNFIIIGRNIMDEIGVKYIYLYEKNNDTWTLVKTFSYLNPDYSATMMESGTSAVANYVTYTNGSALKSYYADCRFYAEKDGGSDTIQQYTPTSYGSNP